MGKESYKEIAMKQLVSFLARNPNDEQMFFDLKSGREFLASLASWAGKGKDEIVQLICREIGTATAAVFKEPISQILENRKLQVTLEFVPNKPTEARKSSKQTKKKSAKKKQAKKKKS